MAVTLKQIAAKTGLSISTVHHVLNGYNGSFADETRRRVKAAAEELKYQPNATARSLVTQKSSLVGVLYYSRNTSAIRPFLSGLQDVLKQNQYSPLFFIHRTVAEELENLESALARRVDGIIVNAAVDQYDKTNADRFLSLSDAGTPVVELNGMFISKVPKVLLDFRTEAVRMVEHLVAAGHRRIALVMYDDFDLFDPGVSRSRYWSHNEFHRGYTTAMKAADLSQVICSYSYKADSRRSRDYAGTTQAIPSLFRDPGAAPTAVVCYHEDSASAIAHYVERTPALSQTKLAIACSLDEIPPGSDWIADRIEIINFAFSLEKMGRVAADTLFKSMGRQAVPDALIQPESFEIEEA